MTPRTRAEPIDVGEVPVIDIAPLRDGTNPGAVGADLARAATEVGFLYVRNHGVDAALVERARRTAIEFFRLPEEAKCDGWYESVPPRLPQTRLDPDV